MVWRQVQAWQAQQTQVQAAVQAVTGTVGMAVAVLSSFDTQIHSQMRHQLQDHQHSQLRVVTRFTHLPVAEASHFDGTLCRNS
jgi:hypothetical protein